MFLAFPEIATIPKDFRVCVLRLYTYVQPRAKV